MNTEAEQKLHVQKQRAEYIIEGTNVGTWEWNVQTGETVFNERWADIIGYTLEELAPISIDTWAKYCHPDDLERSNALLQKCFRGEETYYHCEARMRHKNGTWIWVLDRGKIASWTPDGKPEWMFGTHQDITERKQAELALRESERSLKLALDAGRIGVWNWNIASDTILWDDRSCAFFGVPPGSVFNVKTVKYLFHPDDWDGVYSAFQDSLKNNTRFDRVYRVVRPDGSIRKIHALGEIIQNADGGAPERFAGIHIDRTEELQTQEELRDNQYLLNSAQAMAHMGSWKLDYTQNTAAGTDELYRIMGLRKEETEPSLQTYLEHTHPEDRDRVRSTLEQSLKEGKTGSEIDYRIVRADTGEIRHVHSKTSHIRDDTGRPLYSIGLIQDVTEQVLAKQEHARMEAHLQEIQKLESLGVLAGGIAHDFNNILMSIMGYAEISKSKLSAQSPIYSNLDQIIQSGQVASDLCSQMLAYAGESSVKEEIFCLETLIENTLQMLQTSIAKTSRLRLNIRQDLPCIAGDPSQVSQILMNLVINASEAIGKSGGTITLSTDLLDPAADAPATPYVIAPEGPGPYLSLTVSDTGCGIKPENLSRIFEPFFTDKFMGRGLGLSAVLGIVRAHSGALHVDSEPGRGTTFRVLFPAVPNAECPAPPEDPPHKEWHGQGCVLLVDDEERVRVITGYILKDLGLDVLIAKDGVDALEVYQQHQDSIDIVLLDLTMPRMGGHETFQKLRQINPNIRVVLASGYSESVMNSEFSDKELVGCLKKPYSIGKLSAILSTQLPETGTPTE